MNEVTSHPLLMGTLSTLKIKLDEVIVLVSVSLVTSPTTERKVLLNLKINLEKMDTHVKL